MADLRTLLGEGLDLCVRARKMTDIENEIARRPDDGLPRSATIPLWLEDQYQKDLADWETRARAALSTDAAKDKE